MDTITILLIIFSLVLVFAIGAQDETMATVYGSGSLRLFWAMVMGGGLGFLGVIFLSDNVGKTIGSNLLGMDNVQKKMILAIVISTAIWLLVAIKTHLPISTTHSVVGSVFGIAVVWAIFTEGSFQQSLNWGEMGMIMLGWVISPILGFFGVILMQKALLPFLKKKNKGFLEVEEIEGYFRYLILIAAAVNQFSRGGNDAGNAIGIFYGLVEAGSNLEDQLLVFKIVAGILFSAGLVTYGKKLVANVGRRTTGQLRPSEALAIVATTSLILLLSTIFGFPVSGGHILVFAMIGYARTRGERPDRKNFRKMVSMWVLTFPIAAGLSALVYGVIYLF